MFDPQNISQDSRDDIGQEVEIVTEVFQNLLSDEETTELQLAAVIRKTKPVLKPLPGFKPIPKDLVNIRLRHALDCDEVYPGIYIGDGRTAKNKKYLQKLGVTHVLNAADGKRIRFINTGNDYYEDTTIKYLGIPVDDLSTVDISKYFYEVANFIDEAISTGGKTYVHCVRGVSRSSTCVLAYLMIKKNMLVVDALHLLRASRDVRPNIGFQQQLVQLDNDLRKQRLQSL